MKLLLLLPALVAAFYLIRMLLNSRPALTPLEAHAAVQAGTAVLVDVREPDEWSQGVAAPATLLSFGDLRGSRERWQPFLRRNRDKRIIVYCLSGARSGMAASILKAEGYDAANLGGFSRWRNGGLPTRTP